MFDIINETLVMSVHLLTGSGTVAVSQKTGRKHRFFRCTAPDRIHPTHGKVHRKNLKSFGIDFYSVS
ncbi:MAG: hypothetical protein H2045_03335 [Rhizobiales bacterium]|nr:hypothetical protein [Hyphomicrobiales bacterium]